MKDATSDSVVDYTIDALRDAIRSGEYAPGQRLVVADVTRHLSVSAGPVREAIRRLTGEGLVEIVPHKGASVREITADDIREIHQLREVVEGLAARLAADNVDDPAYRAEIAEIRTEMDLAATTEDAELFLANNRRFHDLIYRMAGNGRLKLLAEQLILPVYQLRLPHRMTVDDLHASYAFHQRIIAAVLNGRASAAEQAMREHVAESARGLIAALETARAARDSARPSRRPRGRKRAGPES
ncbi:GntR family transcriptional regulator [Zavarzinia sp.]|uniref:GntR family transcriptional regulator n=1 Tax=Zavarzinia sp. TaxID=2027920 RepID=UPI0035673CE9